MPAPVPSLPALRFFGRTIELPSIRFLGLLAGIAVVLLTAQCYLTERYRIGFTVGDVQSLPGDPRLFIVDTFDRELVPGRVVAFRVQGVEPVLRDGQLVAKILDGLPGDEVSVREAATTVNGEVRTTGYGAARYLQEAHPEAGIELARYDRDFVVPDGKVFLLGRTERSFDNRYFPLVAADDIVGRVHRLW